MDNLIVDTSTIGYIAGFTIFPKFIFDVNRFLSKPEPSALNHLVLVIYLDCNIIINVHYELYYLIIIILFTFIYDCRLILKIFYSVLF